MSFIRGRGYAYHSLQRFIVTIFRQLNSLFMIITFVGLDLTE